ncbi:MAG: Holliday junction branch migration protein RuvA [Muribaculaceae bacterium]|nr:Holliday junction branch migration protein RuvA [Muribaculaceae bacterium]
MIDYIAGNIAETEPTRCVVDCGGVGYELAITLTDYSRLSGMTTVKLYAHEIIREDSHILFGFLDKETRALFRMLISVNGVGPAMARLILSSMNATQLEQTISAGNLAALKGVKGIGTKTAQRIIVDLKDKINATSATLSDSMPKYAESFEDALAALVMLGFTKPQSEKVLKKVFSQDPSASTEAAIRLVLSMM